MPTARYWRLKCLLPHGGAGAYHRIGEIEMRTTSGGTNLCTGGTAFGNGDYYPASRAFDGGLLSNSQAWAGNPGSPRTVGYDFGAATLVNYITVINSNTANGSELDQHVKEFDIEYSTDNVSWTLALAVRDHPRPSVSSVQYAVITYALHGTVRDKNGALAARSVLAIRESTDAVVATGTSDGTTGAYSLTVSNNDAHTLVFSGEADRNDLIYRGVIPE